MISAVIAPQMGGRSHRYIRMRDQGAWQQRSALAATPYMARRWTAITFYSLRAAVL